MNMLPRHETIREALHAAGVEVHRARLQLLSGEIDQAELQDAIDRRERIMRVLRDVVGG